LWAIGNALHFLMDYARAVAPLDESIALNRKLGNQFGLGWAMHTRALVAINTRDPQTAEPLVAEALEMFSKGGDVSGIAILLDDAAQLARLSGQRLKSLRLAAAAASVQAATGTQLATLVNFVEGRPVAGAVDDEERKAWAEGVAMTPEEAVAYALDESSHL
jgi:hypothetical protein